MVWVFCRQEWPKPFQCDASGVAGSAPSWLCCGFQLALCLASGYGSQHCCCTITFKSAAWACHHLVVAALRVSQADKNGSVGVAVQQSSCVCRGLDRHVCSGFEGSAMAVALLLDSPLCTSGARHCLSCLLGPHASATTLDVMPSVAVPGEVRLTVST